MHKGTGFLFTGISIIIHFLHVMSLSLPYLKYLSSSSTLNNVLLVWYLLQFVFWSGRITFAFFFFVIILFLLIFSMYSLFIFGWSCFILATSSHVLYAWPSHLIFIFHIPFILLSSNSFSILCSLIFSSSSFFLLPFALSLDFLMHHLFFFLLLFLNTIYIFFFVFNQSILALIFNQVFFCLRC